MSDTLPSPIIIGFVGYKQHGKDTAALALMNLLSIRDFPVVLKCGFADEVKRELADLVGSSVAYIEKNKTNPHIRHLLQWWGTDVRRKEDPNYWVKILHTKLQSVMVKFPKSRCVFLLSDVRFPNEASFIKEQGGYLIRIERPSAGSNTDTHASETSVSLIRADITVKNDNTPLKLAHEMRWLLTDYIKPHFKL